MHQSMTIDHKGTLKNELLRRKSKLYRIQNLKSDDLTATLRRRAACFAAFAKFDSDGHRFSKKKKRAKSTGRLALVVLATGRGFRSEIVVVDLVLEAHHHRIAASLAVTFEQRAKTKQNMKGHHGSNFARFAIRSPPQVETRTFTLEIVSKKNIWERTKCKRKRVRYSRDFPSKGSYYGSVLLVTKSTFFKLKPVTWFSTIKSLKFFNDATAVGLPVGVGRPLRGRRLLSGRGRSGRRRRRQEAEIRLVVGVGHEVVDARQADTTCGDHPRCRRRRCRRRRRRRRGSSFHRRWRPLDLQSTNVDDHTDQRPSV